MGHRLFLLFSGFIGLANVANAAICADGTTISDAKCCILVPVLEDLKNNFFGQKEICPGLARSSLRLAFHDAIGFSNTQDFGGGADGSILAFDEVEMKYTQNKGLKITTKLLNKLLVKYDISPGDFLHFAAVVGLSTCPGAPRLPFMLGRPKPTSPASPMSIPEASDAAEDIFGRFSDAGFTPRELVALLASHSIAVGNVRSQIGKAPALDSTPKVFDSQFFLEALLPGRFHTRDALHFDQLVFSPIEGQVRLASDSAIAHHPTTACAWEGFIGEQEKMVEEFKSAMTKLSMVGQNQEAMVDCSELIPIPPAAPPSSVRFPPGFDYRNATQSCLKRQTPPSVPVEPGPSRPSPLVPCGFHAANRGLSELCNDGFASTCCETIDAPSHSSIILVLESLGQRGLDPSSGLVGTGCFTFQHGRDCTTGQPLCCPTLSNSTTHGLVGTACTPIEFID